MPKTKEKEEIKKERLEEHKIPGSDPFSEEHARIKELEDEIRPKLVSSGNLKLGGSYWRAKHQTSIAETQGPLLELESLYKKIGEPFNPSKLRG